MYMVRCVPTSWALLSWFDLIYHFYLWICCSWPSYLSRSSALYTVILTPCKIPKITAAKTSCCPDPVLSLIHDCSLLLGTRSRLCVFLLNSFRLSFTGLQSTIFLTSRTTSCRVDRHCVRLNSRNIKETNPGKDWLWLVWSTMFIHTQQLQCTEKRWQNAASLAVQRQIKMTKMIRIMTTKKHETRRQDMKRHAKTRHDKASNGRLVFGRS